MASAPNAITFKVCQALCNNNTAATFRAFSNRLVEENILSDEVLEQYRPEICSLFEQWRKSPQAQHGHHTQQLPPSPQSSQSPPRQGTPPKTVTSSPPEEVRPDKTVETLEEAVKSVDQSEPLLDAHTASVYLPDQTNHGVVPVNMQKGFCSQSYIRAITLKRNEIEHQNGTIILRWKSVSIHRNEDQTVQRTCFNVVNESEANQAGLHFDMLVGKDHDRPLQEQIRALGVEETALSDSSVIDQPDDLPAQSFEEFRRDTETNTQHTQYHSPHDPTDVVTISGSSRGLANFLNNMGKDMSNGGSAACLTKSQGLGSGKRKFSPSDNSRSPSRRQRPFGGSLQR